MARIMLEMEFPIRSSPAILYDFVSNTSNITQWFCDDLKTKDKDHYIFIWEGESSREVLVEKKIRGKLIRFSYMDAPKGEFLEFEVVKDDLTGDVMIKVTDFCDEDEAEFNQQVWAADMEHLTSVVGAH